MRQSKPVRLETAPTGEQKCLFIFRTHYKNLILAQLVGDVNLVFQ